MKLKFLAIVIGFSTLLSCKKDPQTEVRILPKTSADPLTLTVAKTINDSTIVLKWSKFTGKGFKSYFLTRSSKVFKDGSFTVVHELLKNTTNIDSLTYSENKMPYSTDVQYQIVAATDSAKNTISAYLNYQRPNTYLTGKFTDALIDQRQKTLYLIDHEYGRILSYNYEINKKINSVKLDGAIGYSALGDFEGINELYVPTSDGWLQILNPSTLKLKDRIYVGGERIGSVVSKKGKLIISSSDRSFGSFYNNAIKIYDRKTKQVTGRTGNWDYTRVMLLDNTDFEFIDLTLSIIPTELSYYKISPEGIPLTSFSDSYHGDHPLDGNIVRSFPDGTKFITSGSGAIYTKNLVHEKNMAPIYSNIYSDFAFNNSGSIIYRAFSSEKKIQAVSYPGLTNVQNFKTNLYPAKIFRDGDQLICISRESAYPSNPESIIFIEKFNL